MSAPNILLAYLSPETVLPMTSILATIVGGSMFLSRRLIRLLARCVRGAFRRPQRTAGASKPHIKSLTEWSRGDVQQPG
jgi:hypothetical protein